MKPCYKKWIDLHVPAECHGLCKKFCEKMQRDFPELKMVGGWFIHPIDGKYPHWWLIDDETIIDPTRKQFDSLDGCYHSLTEPEIAQLCNMCGKEFRKLDIFCENCLKDLWFQVKGEKVA